MENREEDEHFVHILKRDHEIDQVSLNHQSRRSTGTSSGSKITTAEIDNSHIVEHTEEIHRAENFLDFNPERYSQVHEDSDDSFEKTENFHVVEKSVHYDPYTTKAASEGEVEEYQHRSSTDESTVVENVNLHVAPHPAERHESPILEQAISHENHEYEKPRSRQHYSTVTVKASDLPQYENPPVAEVRGVDVENHQYVHNILVGQSMRSNKLTKSDKDDDYLDLKQQQQVQQSHQDQEKTVQTPAKKEKNPYMAFDINSEAADPLLAQKYDLDDRDTHDTVQYLNTGFFEIFAEPSPQYHSIACVWTLSFKIFEIVRVYSYKILTLIFGLLIAILAGFFFALFAFINIWIVRPSLFLARCALSQIITIWPLTLIYIVRPFFYSVGAIFSTARLHTSNGANIPEVWEKHVHIV